MPSSSTASLEPALREHLCERRQRALPLRRRAPPRPRRPRPAPAQARCEPSVQRRDADRRREPRRAAVGRQLVRDGAARSRRSFLRRAGHEGLRRRVGARPARDRAHRVPPGLPRPSSDLHRTSTPRWSLSAVFRSDRAIATSSGSSPPRSRTVARRSRTPLQLAGLAERERTVAALASLGHEPDIRAEALEPPRVRRARRGAALTGADAHAKLNLALVVGERLPSGKHEVVTVLAAPRARRPHRARPLRTHSRSTVLRETRSSGQHSSALADTAGVDPALARPDREADPRRRRARWWLVRRGDRARASQTRRSLDPLAVDALHASPRRSVRTSRSSSTRARSSRQATARARDRSRCPSDTPCCSSSPTDARKASTASVYDAVRRRRGGLTGSRTADGAARGSRRRLETADDLAQLPANDLASSPLADALRRSARSAQT